MTNLIIIAAVLLFIASFGFGSNNYPIVNPFRYVKIGFIAALVLVALVSRWWMLEKNLFDVFVESNTPTVSKPKMEYKPNSVISNSFAPTPKVEQETNMYEKIKSKTVEQNSATTNQNVESDMYWQVTTDNLSVYLHPTFKSYVIGHLKINSRVIAKQESLNTDEIVLKNNTVVRKKWYYIQFEDQPAGWVFGAGIK
jgi:hypothetical protein